LKSPPLKKRDTFPIAITWNGKIIPTALRFAINVEGIEAISHLLQKNEVAVRPVMLEEGCDFETFARLSLRITTLAISIHYFTYS
jgi:hypothetical protein